MDERRLAEIEAVATEAAKYDRTDRSMIAGESLSAFANRVTAKVILDLIAALRAALRERDDAQFFADKFKAALHNATDRDREHMQKIAAERDRLAEERDLYKLELDAADAVIERVRAVLDQHWDWKAGRSLYAAIRAALDDPEPGERRDIHCCDSCRRGDTGGDE